MEEIDRDKVGRDNPGPGGAPRRGAAQRPAALYRQKCSSASPLSATRAEREGHICLQNGYGL